MFGEVRKAANWLQTTLQLLHSSRPSHAAHVCGRLARGHCRARALLRDCSTCVNKLSVRRFTHREAISDNDIMRLPPSVAAAAASAMIFIAQPNVAPALATVQPPSTEALTTLRKGYQAAADGLLPSADSLLTTTIETWKKTDQPPEETAALFSSRGSVRQQQGRLADAVSDLDDAVSLLLSPGAKAGPPDVQRAFLQRARLNAALERWTAAEADFTQAITRLDELDAIESTNPFLYNERASVRSRLGRYGGAADDALTAAVEFKAIGDKLRSLLASSDAALALYGAGDVDEAVARMKATFTSYGTKSPATNNPDDIGNLQALARREAELHLAYAAHLYGTDPGANAEAAKKQWETGCIRLESFVTDAMQRQEEEAQLRDAEARQSEASGREMGGTLKASSVAGSLFNTDAIARLNGMDPESPFVTQRPQSAYIWYQQGENSVQRRNPGVPLAKVEPGLSCAKYRTKAWLTANKPEWPPTLVEYAGTYASNVPQGAIVVPPKGAGLDRSQCSVLLSKPGLGDAVPCFQ